MVKTIRIDKRNNFFIDISNNKMLEKYDPENPNLELNITLDDGSILKVNSDNIKQEYGGQVIVQYNEDRFIIDDGYQDILIRAGYIVYDNFDIYQHDNKEVGLSRRAEIINDIRNVLYGISRDISETNNIGLYGNETKFTINSPNFEYTFNFDTVNNMVNKNQQRKNNSLAFYPFSKDMDKYGTIYISIFAKKLEKIYDEEGKYKYIYADNMINNIVSKLGDKYHYVMQPIKRRVISSKGI